MSYLLIDNRKYSYTDGLDLLSAIRENDISMENPCGGNGTCGKCKIKIIEGNVNEITDEERNFLTKSELDARIRLSCLVYPSGDLILEGVNSKVSREHHKILTDGYVPDYEKSPSLSKKLHKLEKPTLDNNISLEDILYKGGIDVKDNFDILKTLPGISENEHCTLVSLDDKVIGIEANDTTKTLYGVAIDIGTTTVVASLIDIDNEMELGCESDINPQKEYGLDVLSRIYYAKSNYDGLRKLNESIIDCLNDLISKLCHKNNIAKENIYEVSIAANTTMMHLLLGIDPKSIGKSPYSPVFIGARNIKAKDLGINISEFGMVYTLPGVSSYIGADIVAGAAVCALNKTDKNILFIDIGTNGEIVLSKKSALTSCSCAAGPALEGMNISCGMRAGDGAIENIHIGETKAEGISTKVIGDSRGVGLCGSGIIDFVSELARLKLIGKTGRIKKKTDVENEETIAYLAEHIVDENKKRKFILDPQTSDIAMTQEDIRQVQLAKGAILSGFYALLNKVEIDMSELDSVIIAGQFGKHLSVESLVGVGIIPKELKENIKYIGNSSKTGAIMALLSREMRREIEKIASNIDYVELSTEKGYERLFSNCLMFN
ncbi:MAG: ASKHA domain-containing protein [Clostridioides sp.]|jgi:uncharacterized 2Fe-2S/4Fe-4S cluster protein (DUF4445 family)|nr:ASKHA domain-containing protein [Clostridioides sp.]